MSNRLVSDHNYLTDSCDDAPDGALAWFHDGAERRLWNKQTGGGWFLIGRYNRINPLDNFPLYAEDLATDTPQESRAN